MARPTNAERAARAATQANATMIEGDTGSETYLRSPAPVSATDIPPAGMATVRVLPKGDGRIATGSFDRAANAFTYHKRGDHLIVENAVARAQEDAGLVEIVSGG